MSCCHGYAIAEGGETAFTVDASAVTFGPGALGEAGDHARALGCRRVALFTDATLAKLEPVAVALALAARGGDRRRGLRRGPRRADGRVVPRGDAAFAREGKFDGYVSVGGGSVIDTCKAALLYATYPAELARLRERAHRRGRAGPRPAAAAHRLSRRRAARGASAPGIAVFDYLALKAKTGIASRRLRPTLALIDPTVHAHAARDGRRRERLRRPLPRARVVHGAPLHGAAAARDSPSARPMSQGRNPWSDVGSREALRLAGAYFVRAVRDASDTEAREALSWAATLAGIAFGNAGVHLPHAMSYSVAGLVRDYRCAGYPQHEAMVPHGISVVVNAPSVFRATARDARRSGTSRPPRLLGADARGAGAGGRRGSSSRRRSSA